MAGRHIWGQPWQWAAASAVALGVTFSVLLISVAYGVRDKITGSVDIPAVRSSHLIDVALIDTILFLLTAVVTSAVLLQTAAMVFILGVTNMRARREEIALRRQSGVLRSRLMREFTIATATGCLIGGVVGDLLGLGLGWALRNYTELPVTFTPVSVFGAFPVTVMLALLATIIPAWRSTLR